MTQRFLAALPVYNELAHVDAVLHEVLRHSPDVLVVDDGSLDGTRERLRQRSDIALIEHEVNRGYGAALRSAFQYALDRGYDVLVTLDCDGQHEPQRIGAFVAACDRADVVSGSRYLQAFSGDSRPPEDRRRINEQITNLVNERLGLRLTDAFCGFKAYRASALARLHVTEDGYGMPLEVWVQLARAQVQIVELPVPLIYLDERRSFGGALDDAAARMAYYHCVLERALAAADKRPPLTKSRHSQCGEMSG